MILLVVILDSVEFSMTACKNSGYFVHVLVTFGGLEPCIFFVSTSGLLLFYRGIKIGSK